MYETYWALHKHFKGEDYGQEDEDPYVPSIMQVVYILTKSLSTKTFNGLHIKLKVTSYISP